MSKSMFRTRWSLSQPFFKTARREAPCLALGLLNCTQCKYIALIVKLRFVPALPSDVDTECLSGHHKKFVTTIK